MDFHARGASVPHGMHSDTQRGADRPEQPSLPYRVWVGLRATLDQVSEAVDALRPRRKAAQLIRPKRLAPTR